MKDLSTRPSVSPTQSSFSSKFTRGLKDTLRRRSANPTIGKSASPQDISPGASAPVCGLCHDLSQHRQQQQQQPHQPEQVQPELEEQSPRTPLISDDWTEIVVDDELDGRESRASTCNTGSRAQSRIETDQRDLTKPPTSGKDSKPSSPQDAEFQSSRPHKLRRTTKRIGNLPPIVLEFPKPPNTYAAISITAPPQEQDIPKQPAETPPINDTESAFFDPDPFHSIAAPSIRCETRSIAESYVTELGPSSRSITASRHDSTSSLGRVQSFRLSFKRKVSIIKRRRHTIDTALSPLPPQPPVNIISSSRSVIEHSIAVEEDPVFTLSSVTELVTSPPKTQSEPVTDSEPLESDSEPGREPGLESELEPSLEESASIAGTLVASELNVCTQDLTVRISLPTITYQVVNPEVLCGTPSPQSPATCLVPSSRSFFVPVSPSWRGRNVSNLSSAPSTLTTPLKTNFIEPITPSLLLAADSPPPLPIPPRIAPSPTVTLQAASPALSTSSTLLVEESPHTLFNCNPPSSTARDSVQVTYPAIFTPSSEPSTHYGPDLIRFPERFLGLLELIRQENELFTASYAYNYLNRKTILNTSSDTKQTMDVYGKTMDTVDAGGEVDYTDWQFFRDPPERHEPPSAPPTAPVEYAPLPEVIEQNELFDFALKSAPNVLYTRFKQYGQLGVLGWCAEFSELIDSIKQLGFEGNMFVTTRKQALKTCEEILQLDLDVNMQIIVMYLSSQVARLRRFLDSERQWDDYPVPQFPIEPAIHKYP